MTMPDPIADGGQAMRYVSESLRSLVRSRIPELASESAVVFASPADIDHVGENTLCLYLYHVDNNPFLRNLPPQLTRRQGAGGPNSLDLVAPPLVLDLNYMAVYYAKSPELELVLGNKLVRLFHDVGALAGDLLHPQLRRMGNVELDIIAQHSSLDAMRHLWAGFPNKPYKLTNLYTVSPLRVPSTRAPQADMATDASTRLGGRR
jgi:hypothetical protein